jgi:oligopeptide/dipeptide ABC transporter ATP-binding protein
VNDRIELAEPNSVPPVKGAQASTESKATVLSVTNLQVQFRTRRGVGNAVDGVSFKLRRGETLALVGESGSGKSITAASLIGLNPQPASHIVGGQIIFDGVDLLKLPPVELRKYRGRRIAMVLQDAMSALNPVLTIRDQLSDPLRRHQHLSGQKLLDEAIRMLSLLRIPAPKQRLRDYPHEFSGGMSQRVVGAITLACSPDVLIADEPTTSLDVTVQAAYLAVLKDIQNQTGISILFITHDFGVVARLCDRVAVMYAGKLVETAPTRELFEHPAHPYTQALLRSVPDVRESVERLPAIEGAPPSIYSRTLGCPFAPRCPYVMSRCQVEYPPQMEISAEHTANCWRLV